MMFSFNSITDLILLIFTLLMGFLFYNISRFYLKVWSLPPGPIPLPFIGNILYFRGTKKHPAIETMKFAKKYGSVFTLWLGPKPLIIINDIDIARETFKQNEFSGRPDSFFGSLFSNKNFTDVVFSDFGNRWEILRRIAFSAVRKYANSEKLAILVKDEVDKTLENIFNIEESDKPFEVNNYIYLLFFNITAASAFNEKYNIEDDEFRKLKYSLNDLRKEIGIKFIIWEFVPILRYFDRRIIRNLINHFDWAIDLAEKKFIKHYKNFDNQSISDFCDALISAKNETLAEKKEIALYLTNKNLAMVVLDLFIGGTETSYETFMWILKIIAFYPEIQKKIREEILFKIGERMPIQADRNRCHYINAFLSETMRTKNIVPFGLFHKTTVNSKIGNFTIPENTGVIVHQYSILNDKRYWNKPNEFFPERFLENGVYISNLTPAFIPFSVGRRTCLGEKLGMANLFLVLVRFFQKTHNYEIAFENNNLETDIHVVEFLASKKDKIIFETLPV